MEKIGKENQQILLDLAAINQDRVEGYRTAIGILDKRSDAELIAVFENAMQQAQQFKTELIALAFHAETRRPDEREFSRMPWLITQQPRGGPCPSRETLIAICIKEESECQDVYRLSQKSGTNRRLRRANYQSTTRGSRESVGRITHHPKPEFNH